MDEGSAEKNIGKTGTTQQQESLEEEIERHFGARYDRARPADQTRQEYINERAGDLFDAGDRIAAAQRTGERLAYQDQLTGLPNRRGFQESIDLAYKEAENHPGTEVYLFILDLDDFSLVNNTYGHKVGDQVLVAAANLLKSGVRPSDSVARLGGEELAVVFVNQVPTFENQHVERMNPLAVANRLKRGVTSTVEESVKPTDPNDLNKTVTLKQTTSIGVAKLTKDPTTGKFISPEELLDNADTALYQAKHRGKDRVVSYEKGMKKPPPVARKTK